MPRQRLRLTKKAKSSARAVDVGSLDQHEMVAREAYLLAEKRGFDGGDQVLDWLQAEKKVNEMLNMNS